jgi:hypothetical protein
MSFIIAVSVVPNDLTIYCAVIRTRSSPSVAIGCGIAVSRTQRDDLTSGTKTWRALFYNLQIKSSLPRKKTHTQQQRRSSYLAPLLKQRQKEAFYLCTFPPRPPPKLMNNIR